MPTNLYHCTDFISLCSILKSGEFWPSYCYERADYLSSPENFAFAMICFADLMKSEVKSHLKKFNKDCYLRMSKSWARRNGLSNVVYYERRTVVSSSFKLLVEEVAKRYESNGFKLTNDVRFTSMLMAYFKQYEGFYWNDNQMSWDNKRTVFFTEREWRYVPLVKNHEAFFLSSEEFLDKKLRDEKRKQLIENGYTLKFSWNDIEQIGVHSLKQWFDIYTYFVKEQNYTPIEILNKVKIVF